jgi:hypothetical protein
LIGSAFGDEVKLYLRFFFEEAASAPIECDFCSHD